MISVTIPGLVTTSGDNARSGSWHAKAKKIARERTLVRLVLGAKKRPPLPVMVTLTRIAPRSLDSAGLQSALKGVEDQVAAWLGVDDGRAERAERVLWVKHNEKAGVREYGGRIEIATIDVAAVKAAAAAHPVLAAILKGHGWAA